MTTFSNVSTVCISDHHISVGPTSNFVPFYSPWMLLPRWPIKRHAFVLFILGDPCSFVVLKIPSHDITRCSLIELPHDLLAHCSSCLLVVLQKNYRWFVVDWLTSDPNYNPILNCAGSPRRFSSRDSKMENTSSIGIGPRIQL
jgi:hypothetical protein